MTSAPTVSVVMPAYNAERFLADAIQSILAQTFRDFELLIIDDGSTDKTPNLLEAFASTDPRIRVHRHEVNRGMTAAMNQGVKMARGRLVARMDADDVSVPHRFERQVAYLDGHPDIAVVGSWVRIINEDGVQTGVARYPIEPELVAWCMLFFNTISHPTVMMRRSALDAERTYSEVYLRAQDYALFIGLSRKVKLANLEEPLLLYRAWGGNASRDASQMTEAVDIVTNFISELGQPVSSSEVRLLLGLSRGDYPATANDIASVGRLIQSLHLIYTSENVRSRRVTGDAAVRLWLLAALAARRSPAVAMNLALAATRMQPMSIFSFGVKTIKKLYQD